MSLCVLAGSCRCARAPVSFDTKCTELIRGFSLETSSLLYTPSASSVPRDKPSPIPLLPQVVARARAAGGRLPAELRRGPAGSRPAGASPAEAAREGRELARPSRLGGKQAASQFPGPGPTPSRRRSAWKGRPKPRRPQHTLGVRDAPTGKDSSGGPHAPPPVPRGPEGSPPLNTDPNLLLPHHSSPHRLRS